MKTRRRPYFPRDSRGFTLAELLVSVAIFVIIGLGLGSLYLSSTRAMDEGSSMAYFQRQGTQIQEELARHIQRATILGVDPPGAAASLCQPASGVTLSPGKSMLYQRTVGTSASTLVPPPAAFWPSSDEFWCVYEYKRATDDYAQLWRCQVSGITPPQTCTTPTAAENLIASALRGSRGWSMEVSGTCFTQTGTTCPPPAPTCIGCPTSVDVAFALDVKRSSTDPRSMVGGPRQFGFNITIRN